MGSVVQFKTTSFESIQRIQGSLMQILQTTGGRLRGIPLKMVLRPGKTKYYDKDNVLRKGNAFFVNIEFRQKDWKDLVPQLMADSASYSLAMKKTLLLTEHVDDDTIDIDEGSERQQAKDMTAEFFPDNTESEKKEPESDDRLDGVCKSIGLNDAQKDTMLGVFKGDYDAALAWGTKFLGLVIENNKTKVEALALFSKALLQPGAVEQLFAPAKEQPKEVKPARTAKKVVEKTEPVTQENAMAGQKFDF
jgi:hypothetical protein